VELWEPRRGLSWCGGRDFQGCRSGNCRNVLADFLKPVVVAITLGPSRGNLFTVMVKIDSLWGLIHTGGTEFPILEGNTPRI
jgi:hypothetical protein